MKTLSIEDSLGRTFKTLRVSLTSTCNLGCVYCISGTEKDTLDQSPLDSTGTLSVDEILYKIGSLHELLDLRVIRLTGGEPTLYNALIPLIEGIRKLGILEIKMTSNAFLLKNKAKALAEAGLTHLNISLDAIDPEEFYKVSRRKNITKIIEGIDEAIASGIDVKLNSVIMKGVNENQIIPLLNFAFERNIIVRFLELMKMGHLQKGAFQEHFYSESNILKEIGRSYKFSPLIREDSSTANYWKTEEGKIFGIIANESHPFCHDCNRLRMDSYGNIYGCLSENKPISIVENYGRETLVEKLKLALGHKQRNKFKGSEISMLTIGG